MRGLPRLAAVLGAAALVEGIGSRAAAQDMARRDTLDEAPLTLVYRPYVRAIVTALQRHGAFYLPLGETLARLEINHDVDPRKGTATGRYLRKRTEYRVDFRTGAAAVGERAYSLARESFLITELEIFVLPSVLEQLFSLTSTVDSHMLIVEITAAEELPVAESFRRRERQALLAVTSESKVVPLRYARERQVLDGGVLEYFFVGESADRSKVARFQMVGGGELLGGDLQASVRGSRGAEHSRPIEDGDWRWHYVVGDAAVISQFTVGRFYSSGLQPKDLHGLQITNRPVELRTRLGTYAIDGVVEPNAEIELYVNDRLAGIARADPLGHYAFALPLSYGMSMVRVQSYGPSGDVRREERALQIPFALVPHGRADYDVELGRSRQTGAPDAHGRIAVGLSDRLTSSVGVDFGGSDSARRWIPYGGLSARIGSGHIMSVDAAPRVLYRATWEGVFPSRATVGATATK